MKRAKPDAVTSGGSRITVAVRTEPQAPQPKWRDVLPIHPAAEAFPRKSTNDFRTLAKDIKEHRLNVPVVLLRNIKHGTTLLLDGISRLDALEAIGVQLVQNGNLVESYEHDRKEYPMATTVFDTECDPSAVVRSLNAHRRHLTPEQKRGIIGNLLKASPEKSDRQVAKLAGVSHPHVGKVRRSLEQTGDVETVSTSTDTKGRKQPRTKKRGPAQGRGTLTSGPRAGEPRRIARKLAPLEKLEPTRRRLERENVQLKSEIAMWMLSSARGARSGGASWTASASTGSSTRCRPTCSRICTSGWSHSTGASQGAPSPLMGSGAAGSEGATPNDLDIPPSLRRPSPAPKQPVG